MTSNSKLEPCSQTHIYTNLEIIVTVEEKTHTVCHVEVPLSKILDSKLVCTVTRGKRYNKPIICASLLSYLPSWTCPAGFVWLPSAGWSSRPPHQGSWGTGECAGTPGCVWVWVPEQRQMSGMGLSLISKDKIQLLCQMAAAIIQTSKHREGKRAQRFHKSDKNRIMSFMAFYRWGGGSAQLLLQPRLLGLLQLRAGRGVIEQLGVQNQAEDSTHLRQQEEEEAERCGRC